jgi:ABC-type multidrug transport system ATPase subunit/ABC-type multidrug transport system permease subunit
MDKVELATSEGFDLTSYIPRIRLTWENLELTIVKKIGYKKTQDISVLKGISGTAEPGQMLTIMGTSGAGKSSLMSVLTGHITSGKFTKIAGEVKANGVSIYSLSFSKLVGNVLQEDLLLANLTVRESIQFSADLRTDLSTEEKKYRVDKLLDDLLLTKCEDTYIGSQNVRGISGGEKKRVCIGIELITNPSILFLDEPTSGLDSYTALAIMTLIKEQANLGRTVICTLHQPSSEIVELMDSLLVMTDGHIVYHSSPLLIEEWFQKLDFTFPDIGNPVDYLMDIISSQDERFETKEEQNELLLTSYKQSLLPIEAGEEDEELRHVKTFSLGVWAQFCFLFIRSCKDTFRSKMLLRAKIGIAVFLSAILDMLFYKISDDRQGIQNRNGLFFMLNVGLFMSGMVQVVLTFPLQRAVFLKEQSCGMYGSYTYFWTKLIPELIPEVLTPALFFVMLYWAVELNTDSYDKPLIFLGICILVHMAGSSVGLFVGCVVSNVDSISAFIPMVFMPNLVFSGFLANLDSIPIPIRWLTYLTPFRYSFASMVQNEYHGITLSCEDESPPCTPLSDLNIDLSLWRNIILLASITVGFRLISAVALKLLVRRIYG